MPDMMTLTPDQKSLQYIRDLLQRKYGPEGQSSNTPEMVFMMAQVNHRHGGSSRALWELAREKANAAMMKTYGIGWDDLPDGNELEQVLEADDFADFASLIAQAINEKLFNNDIPQV